MSSEMADWTVERANDKLAEALHDANVYCGHDEVRPSAIRAFDKVQEAHDLLNEIDDSRTADVDHGERRPNARVVDPGEDGAFGVTD